MQDINAGLSYEVRKWLVGSPTDEVKLFDCSKFKHVAMSARKMSDVVVGEFQITVLRAVSSRAVQNWRWPRVNTER